MNKTNTYSTKGAFEIKDIDSEKRRVAMYLSTFDVIDSDNDMIQKGAFTKSITERGPGTGSNRQIAFLRWHDWEKPIGKFIELGEDQKGLFAVGEMGNSTIANDAWNDYADGIIREHSIGFKYMADKIKWIDDSSMEIGGYYLITELKLYEGSAVTFGSNEFTNVIDVTKSEQRIVMAVKYANEIDTLTKALANGKGTDDRLFEIEMKLKYLNGQLLLLAKNEPQTKHSLIVEPTNTIENSFDWNAVVNGVRGK